MNETATSPGVITYTYDSASNTISANQGKDRHLDIDTTWQFR